MKRKNVLKTPLLFLGGLCLLMSSCKKENNNTTASINYNSTIKYGEITDADSNTYKTVQIGTQTWMAQNLRTTKYNNGTKIRLITVDAIWIDSVRPAMCWYSNNPSKYKETYGALYNGYAVDTNILCPKGWHIPSDNEWQILITYVGGDIGKLRESGTSHWEAPNSGASNASGFTALPTGLREPFYGSSSSMGQMTEWLTSTSLDNVNSASRFIDEDNAGTTKNEEPRLMGLPVRCLKND